MIRPQFVLDLHDELIVDNFAGGGGASTGIELALGRCVDIAVNHDRFALGMHRINHPQTDHHCEDVFDVDPATICKGRPVGLAHFSPDCKHFSKAKGGKPLDKRIRGLVLVMLRWAKYGARVLTMENVEEIRTWGPLVRLFKNGRWDWYPDREHRGRTWLAFLDILGTGVHPEHPDLPEILEVLAGSVTRAECVRGFGYRHEAKEIRASGHGAPTIRKRLYMIARRDGRPIVWPEPTHAETPAPARRLKPWRTVAECIGWSLPCPSIFLSGPEARAARCKRPLAKATLRRVAKGVDRFVLKSKRPFLVNLTHQGGNRVESIEEPARTLTAARRGEKALVAPTLSRFNGDHRDRADGATRNYSLEQPLSVQDTSNRFAVTTAALAPFITEHANASNQRNLPADEPARTTCAEVKGGHFALVAANLLVNTSGHPGGPADAPSPTIPTGGHHAVVMGTLVGAGGRAAQSWPRGLNEPFHTATAKGDTCLAAASMVKLRGNPDDHPGVSAEEPLHTVSTGGNHGIVAASIVRHFGESVGQPADAPAPTTVAGGGGKTGVVAAYLAQHNGGFNETPGHGAAEPISTIGTTGSQQQVVAASLTAYYGSERDGQPVTAPARTLMTKPRLGLVESTAVPAMTEAQVFGARRVAAFLRAHGVQFEGEFATVDGFVVVDIGMRMLSPRELFRAQGFSDRYVIDRAWVVDPATGEVVEVRLTKEQQVRMCGNSVCPPVACALVAANVPEMAAWGRGERRAA